MIGGEDRKESRGIRGGSEKGKEYVYLDGREKRMKMKIDEIILSPFHLVFLFELRSFHSLLLLHSCHSL